MLVLVGLCVLAFAAWVVREMLEAPADPDPTIRRDGERESGPHPGEGMRAA